MTQNSRPRRTAAQARALAAQRQAARRARIVQAGRCTITVEVDRKVAELLRTLAREHKQPAYKVSALGVLMAHRELEARAARDQAGQEPT